MKPRDVFADPRPQDEIAALFPPERGSGGRNVRVVLRVVEASPSHVRAQRSTPTRSEQVRYPRAYWLQLRETWDVVYRVGGP